MHASTMPYTAALPANAPAFMREPVLVFARAVPAPSRSELLRQQIAAARGLRG